MRQGIQMITEIHTSDLTARCLKSVELRHNRKIIAEATGALYKGLLFGECCRMIHERASWEIPSIPGIMLESAKAVAKQLSEERRPLSDAVNKSLSIIQTEVLRFVEQYAGRQRDHFKNTRLIGCELPIRVTIDVDGEEQEFASHLDLAYRMGNVLYVRDWKLREDAPTTAYLGRNLQMALYWFAVKHGQVMVGDEWVAFDEYPIIEWFDAQRLGVYKRATTIVDEDTGEEIKVPAGTARPIEKIVRTVVYQPEQEAAFLNEIATRVRMFRAGMYPTNPDPIGCHLCESNRWCPTFDMVNE